jgi:hypothetical protein
MNTVRTWTDSIMTSWMFNGLAIQKYYALLRLLNMICIIQAKIWVDKFCKLLSALSLVQFILQKRVCGQTSERNRKNYSAPYELKSISGSLSLSDKFTWDERLNRSTFIPWVTHRDNLLFTFRSMRCRLQGNPLWEAEVRFFLFVYEVMGKFLFEEIPHRTYVCPHRSEVRNHATPGLSCDAQYQEILVI